MAKQQFDLVILKIGYYEYALPKAAAMQFMDMCVGADIYRWDSHWTGSQSEQHAIPLEESQMPSIRLVGPAQFLQAVELRKAYEEEQRAKKKAEQ